MNPDVSKRPSRGHWIGFAAVLSVVAAAYLAYGVNMMLWKDATDYGWRAMYDSGPHVVDEVFGRGWQAGLRPGDRILFINGRSYDTFDELFFQVRNTEPGDTNVYTVQRSGRTVDIYVTNGVLGWIAVVKRSGPLFAVGLLYIFLGALVYTLVSLAEKKPRERVRESWVFLFMTSSLGVAIAYASPSGLMSPLWLFKVRQFVDVFLPAPIIHLALLFPARRRFMNRLKWIWFVPYLVSLAIFLFYRPLSTPYWDPPDYMDMANNLYLLTAVILFTGLTLLNFRKGTPFPLRVQSRLVLLGILIGFFLPVLELLLRNIGDVFLFSDPALTFALLFSVFPICIGYTLVKYGHYWEIDITARRTVGYSLVSAFIIGTYVLLVAGINFSVPAIDVARSRVFTALFAIALVVAFRPLHEKVQRVVDRYFYNIKLDYKTAVLSIGTELSIFSNVHDVVARINHAVRDLMSIDCAGVILIEPDSRECHARFIYDAPDEGSEGKYKEERLDCDYPLVALMKREKKVITKDELERDISFSEEDEPSRLTKNSVENFRDLRAVLALPLLYQDEVIGVLVLGRKKYGRFYAMEHIDLLKTLANQGAVALENARMVERAREEEKFRLNLSRYVSPQVVDKINHSELEGERKKVAVLISDIRGFTELTRNLAPDRLVAILNEYRTEMVRIIFRYDGSLDKYVGDAIVAVFGGFIHLDNPTSSAVKAAIDMRDGVRRLNHKWRGQHVGLPMDVGYGIDIGEVFMGNVGSQDRMEYTVIGEAVNTADYLSNQAKPNQILLSETASMALGGKVAVRELETGKTRRKKDGHRILEVVREVE